MLTATLSKQAQRYLDRQSDAVAARILDRIEALCRDPHDRTVALKGLEPLRRARIGGFRIVYFVTESTVEVTRIGPRGDVYKDL